MDFDLEAARQPQAFAPIFALALAQQHRAVSLEFLRKHGDGVAGPGDAFAVSLGLLGRAVDFGSAVADRNDEMRCRGGVIGYLAGGLVLLRHRAVDVFEHRPDRRDRL